MQYNIEEGDMARTGVFYVINIPCAILTYQTPYSENS
jgi:hypothetical protein